MMDLSFSLKDSLRIMDDVATKISGVIIHDLPEDRRLQIAGALFKLAIDHSQAIVVLVGAGSDCYSSALALQRPCFEAFTRGLWVKWCATDPEIIDVVKKDEFPPGIETKIETSEVFSGQLKALKSIKQQFWTLWCSLTHGGMEQIVGQLSTSGIESNHDPGKIQQALYWASLWQLVSATQLAAAADDEPLVRYFVERLESIGAIDSAS